MICAQPYVPGSQLVCVREGDEHGHHEARPHVYASIHALFDLVASDCGWDRRLADGHSAQVGAHGGMTANELLQLAGRPPATHGSGR